MAKLWLAPRLPQYDDLTLFALSLAFLLLALIDGQLRRDLFGTLSKYPIGELMALLLLTRVGVGDTDCIIDEEATFAQVLVTAVACSG